MQQCVHAAIITDAFNVPPYPLTLLPRPVQCPCPRTCNDYKSNYNMYVQLQCQCNCNTHAQQICSC
eukprot:7358809-Pyramimonas_sp.AAC.1